MDSKNPGIIEIEEQAYPPSPLEPPPMIVPEEPLSPVLPAGQGSPPADVSVTFTPDAPNIDPASQLTTPVNSRDFNVTGLGSFETNPEQALKNYVIQSIVDSANPATPLGPITVNLLITLSQVSVQSLASYGVSLIGRQLLFLDGLWNPLQPMPSRQILSTGEFALLVPNRGSDGNPFNWPAGPGAGDTVAVDVARTDSQDVYQVTTGPVQDVVPSTDPLPTSPGAVSTGEEIISVNVSDQLLTNGTPLEIHIV